MDKSIWYVKCPFCGASIAMIGPDLTVDREDLDFRLTATIQMEKHFCAEQDLAAQAVRDMISKGIAARDEHTGTGTEGGH